MNGKTIKGIACQLQKRQAIFQSNQVIYFCPIIPNVDVTDYNVQVTCVTAVWYKFLISLCLYICVFVREFKTMVSLYCIIKE